MLLVGPVNPKRFVLESLFAVNDYNFLRISSDPARCSANGFWR
jgi:hypothetical protein